MAKNILTEGVLDNIISAIFTAIGKGETIPATKKLMKYPEYRRLHTELEASKKKLEEWLKYMDEKYPMPKHSWDENE